MGTESYRNGKSSIYRKESTSAYWIQDLKRLILISSEEIEGKSFIDGEDWNRDPNGHGTHCAGIATGNIKVIPENGTELQAAVI
jgi:subtilisin family serine protease